MKDFLKPVKKIHKLYFALPSTILLLCCIAGLLTYVVLTESIKSLSIKQAPINLPSKLVYPYYSGSTAEINSLITADAAIVMDDSTKTAVYTKNPKLRFSPASTTKLITSLVGMDHYKLDDELVIKSSKIEGTVVGFTQGERVKFRDLLYGMLLPSGNDAAVAVAENYPGGERAFVNAMNQKVKNLGLTGTHFADPAGLLDDDTYTRVNDLALIASQFMKNPILSDIVRTKYAAIVASDGQIFQVENLNKLLGSYGVDGIKTGHTEGAGDVLVTSVERGDRRYIIVVMRSDDRFADTKILIQRVVDNIILDPVSL